MSNALAIPAVNAAFKRRLLASVVAAVPGADVRLGTPTAKLAEDANPLVNLHLFRAEPNATHANDHLASRSAAGDRQRPSSLALDLHYVLSFYGNHDTFEPDILLSEVMLSLEDQPLLSKTTIAGAIANNDEIEDSDLDKALARLRVTREMLTLDDFSKIWSIFYQVPYVMSLSYRVSHVLLETGTARPPALPVAGSGLWVAPISTLRLDRAGGSEDFRSFPVWGGKLHVGGAGLGAFGLGLEADGTALVTDGVTQRPEALEIPLDAATFGGALSVGIHRLQAIAPARDGQPDHLRARSNALAFALHPSITLGAHDAPAGGQTATGTLSVTFSPAIGPEQSVRLLLDSRDPANPGQVVLPGRAPDPNGAAATDLDFSFTDLPRRTWLVRADVDGLVSPVTIDATPGSATLGQITGPELSL